MKMLIKSTFRAAKIPCTIIKGFAKSAGYDVGQRDLGNLRNVWNAVYINGGWRFVFPLWASRVVVGHSTGKWTLVEAKGHLF
jgi:transglutaminase/protease-like cytokinesis protein 3